MSEQDDAQSSTKQRRSRKINTTDQQNGKQAPALQRPANDDTEGWKAYWKAQGQPWRTEPEIDAEKQKHLTERRSIKPVCLKLSPAASMDSFAPLTLVNR